MSKISKKKRSLFCRNCQISVLSTPQYVQAQSTIDPIKNALAAFICSVGCWLCLWIPQKLRGINKEMEYRCPICNEQLAIYSPSKDQLKIIGQTSDSQKLTKTESGMEDTEKIFEPCKCLNSHQNQERTLEKTDPIQSYFANLCDKHKAVFQDSSVNQQRVDLKQIRFAGGENLQSPRMIRDENVDQGKVQKKRGVFLNEEIEQVKSVEIENYFAIEHKPPQIDLARGDTCIKETQRITVKNTTNKIILSKINRDHLASESRSDSLVPNRNSKLWTNEPDKIAQLSSTHSLRTISNLKIKDFSNYSSSNSSNLVDAWGKLVGTNQNSNRQSLTITPRERNDVITDLPDEKMFRDDSSVNWIDASSKTRKKKNYAGIRERLRKFFVK